ncbi:hypothetical protein CTI12_AA369680 [Artemisia annua]|uniref:DUF659 domain-containing protein n=1 Tax=Artemisia annua TaxID=35608 RepID=A0A2U1MJR5_ARTAN|nr:hypothetical protein CTI12_AA369680 [Artemisia annua]
MDSSSSAGNNASGSVPTTQATDKGPLWEYVTKISKTTETGGISTCKRVKPESLIEMKNKEKECEDAKSNSAPKDVPLPCGGSDFENTLKKRKSSSSPLVRSFDVDTRTQLDQEIARMFFTGGLPFNLARNPHYMRAFTFAANHILDGYVPPGYNKLRTTLLQQEKSNVERLLKPIKETWREKGVTIVTDGWSDPQ